MRAVVQRVKEAWVRVSEEEVARIGQGLLVLAGVAADDGPGDVDYLAQKLAHLRVFPGAERLLNLSLLDTGFEVLLVSQFTILGDCRKGRRPPLLRRRLRSWPKCSTMSWPPGYPATV